MVGKSRSQINGFRFIDAFSGIGGFRYGLQAAGGRCVYSIEYDRFARATYAANFAEAPEGVDIRDTQALPQHDVLAAGFPCQPFSLAGVSKKNSLGRPHGFLDEAQGTLFFELGRLIESSRPPVVLLENVRNLLSHDRGRTFSTIRAVLDELGYAVSYEIIDARHWVPQSRKRVFIVGLSRSVYGPAHFRFPMPPEVKVTFGAIKQKRTPAKYTISPRLWRYLRDYAEKHRKLGNGFGFGLVDAGDVTRTLSARYHKDGSEILVSRGRLRPRRLTPLECRRLMGFPEDFVLTGSDTQIYRQFGNAVVVPVVTHVAHALIDQGFLAGTLPEDWSPRYPASRGTQLQLFEAS